MKRFIPACLTTLLTLVLFALPAQAADTWLPDFNPNSHVYVDQQLNGNVSLDANFEQQVQARATKNNLNVYIVVTQQGDEIAPTDRDNWAPNMLHGRLWDRWRYSTGFSEDRILILLYIREKNSLAGSVAARSGTYLHGLGLDRNRFANSNGPVLPAARQYIRTNPTQAFLSILDNINTEIEAASGTSNNSSPQKDSGWWFGWPAWVWILIIIIVICLLIWLFAKASGGGSGSSSGGGTYIFAGCGGGSSGGSSCGGGASCGGGGSC